MKRVILIGIFLTFANLCFSGERQYAKDYPNMKSQFDNYKWYINYINGAGSCVNVYAFGAGSPTPDLNIIYISCDKDKSEWLIGINKKSGDPINATRTKIYTK